MKCFDKLLIIIFLAIWSIGCSNQNLINVEKYICPDLKGEMSVLYEYNNTNSQALPLKYLLIRRESINEKIYTYSYLDTSRNIIGSSTETRMEDYTRVTGISNFEFDDKGNIIETKIKIDSLQIPFQLQMGTEIKGQWQWKSKVDESLNYSQLITRKLVGKNDVFPFQDSTVSIVEFDTTEETKVVNNSMSDKDVIHENTSQFYSNLTFAQGIGIIEINMRFSDGTEIKLFLDQIHTGEEVDLILAKQNGSY